MAGYLNKAIIIGNIGKDPEMRTTAGGNPVTNFSVATTEKYNDKQGVKQEHTEWHNIVVWGKLAEIAGQYLKKGSSVCVEGKIQTQSWEKDGTKHYKAEIVASNFQMLDAKPQDQQSQGGFGGQQQQQQQQQPQQQQSQGFGGQQQQQPQQQSNFSNNNFDNNQGFNQQQQQFNQ
jgi:single-strand DNA-binding protein